MKLDWNDDQRALLDAVGQVVERHRAFPAAGSASSEARYDHSAAFERDLEAGGYFEASTIDGLGPTVAAALVIELARAPACAEIGASALLAPRLGLPRPCAVLGADRRAPARFLDGARSVVAIDDQAVRCALLDAGDPRPVESLYAYPMGVLVDPDRLDWQRVDIDPAEALDLQRLAIGCETVGVLGAALDSVVEHVRHRRQFGRPLGAFQAVQHRLATDATHVEGARWLLLAAAAATVPAALAVARAQRAVRPVCYDLHQFMGAMGLTLEHPLHRWTYRARRLQSELGGAERQFIAAARAAWPTETP